MTATGAYGTILIEYSTIIDLFEWEKSMRKKFITVVLFVIIALFLCSCDDGTSTPVPSSNKGNKPSQSEDSSQGNNQQNSQDEYSVRFNTWAESDSAGDLNNDEEINEEDFEIYLAYISWLDSDDAIDYDKDRKVDMSDYEYYNAYKTWKLSDNSYDLNADRRIDYEDYALYLNPDAMSFVKWARGAYAADVDGNGEIDEEDYFYSQQFIDFIGTFRITDFTYGNEMNVGFDESEFTIMDLIDYLPDITVTIDKYGKFSCTYPQEMEEALGVDNSLVQAAINSARASKMSDYYSRIYFTIDGIYVSIPLTERREGVYSTVFSVTVEGTQITIGFAIEYDG